MALLLSCLAAVLVPIGCEKAGNVYRLSHQEILSLEAEQRGSIYEHKGTQQGPYMKTSSMVGNENTAGSVSGGQDNGRVQVSWPATPGHFYEGTLYLNPANEALVIVRKVPSP